MSVRKNTFLKILRAKNKGLLCTYLLLTLRKRDKVANGVKKKKMVWLEGVFNMIEATLNNSLEKKKKSTKDMINMMKATLRDSLVKNNMTNTMIL